MPTTTIFLALGTNLGDRDANLTAAVAELSKLKHVVFLKESSRIITKPVGGPAGQGDFLNSVCKVDTTLSPDDLLHATQAIEKNLGRPNEEERVRWGPRLIDIDILLYGDTLINLPRLCIPHPRLAERRFVLEPLAEIAAGVVVPGVNLSVHELLMRLNG